MTEIEALKEEIERQRARLDDAIRDNKAPETVQQYSSKLDKVIEKYLDIVEEK